MFLEINTFGNPAEAIKLVKSPSTNQTDESTVLGENQVKVKLHASPINPADLNYAQGTYGIKPTLPAQLGIEGAGTIIESNDPNISTGTQVIFINHIGCWSEEVITSNENILPLITQIDFNQAAMLKVNPMTAWCMLHAYAELEEGDYIIQNAANSGVGQCVIQLAKLLGLKTINLVRREELIDPLKSIGADIVLIDDENVVENLKKIIPEEDLPKLALNAVGGDSALRLMDALSTNGDHVTYGAMSLRSLKVPNKFLIFKGISLHGFWLKTELENIPKPDLEDIYNSLALWVAEGKLYQQVDSTYTLDKYQEAFTQNQSPDRVGKVLFTMQ